MTLPSIAEDVEAYEEWLRGQLGKDADADALKLKRRLMRQDPLKFLRATYFRWARAAPQFTGLADAPRALSVGDAHVENFGCWRDAEGRLAWGVNDFDEASVMPAALDLVRLLVSLDLAGQNIGRSARALLKGYRDGLALPQPISLHEGNGALREAITCNERQRHAFWREIDRLVKTSPPPAVRTGLLAALPAGSENARFFRHRQPKGGGSLGRRRYLVVADWQGARVVRESKALAPSAWLWAHQLPLVASPFQIIAAGPHRAPDRFLRVDGGVVYRRLAPDARKLEIRDPALRRLGPGLVELMGRELAAVHAGTPGAAATIAADLGKRRRDWLVEAAKVMRESIREDYRVFRRH